MPPSDFTCPTCGEEVHPNSKSCPHCDTTPENGWASGGEIVDGYADLDLPDEDFDYDEFIAREFDGGGNPLASPRLNKIWLITGLILLGTIAFLIVRGLW